MAVFLVGSDVGCEWHKWTKVGEWALDLGADLFFYVDKQWKGDPAKEDVFGPTGN